MNGELTKFQQKVKKYNILNNKLSIYNLKVFTSFRRGKFESVIVDMSLPITKRWSLCTIEMDDLPDKTDYCIFDVYPILKKRKFQKHIVTDAI